MNLPIYEQVRRTVPCSMLCDNTPADELEAIDTDVDLDQLPVYFGRPNEMPSVILAILSMVGLVLMLAFIGYASVVSA